MGIYVLGYFLIGMVLSCLNVYQFYKHGEIKGSFGVTEEMDQVFINVGIIFIWPLIYPLYISSKLGRNSGKKEIESRKQKEIEAEKYRRLMKEHAKELAELGFEED